MISYISSTLEFLMVYLITRKLLYKSLLPNAMDICMFFCYGLLAELLFKEIPFVNFLCLQIYLILYIFIEYKKSLLNTVILAAITAIMIMLLEIVSAAVLSFLPFKILHTYMPIFGSLFTIPILALFLHISFIQKIYIKATNAALVFKILIFNTFIMFIATTTLLKVNNNIVLNYSPIIASVFIFIITLNIACILYENKVYEKQHQLESYEKNFLIYDSLLTDIRASQHEYSNRMHTINTLIDTSTSLDELKQSLRSITENAKRPLSTYPLLNINMPILAATLYHWYLTALDNNIRIQFDVKNTKLVSQIDEVLLSDLASILLHNAIEACSNNDIIYVCIYSDQTKTTIEVRNPVDRVYSPTEISQFFKTDYSSKHDKKSDGISHGLGLSYLKKTVLSNNGILLADFAQVDNLSFIIMKIVL